MLCDAFCSHTALPRAKGMQQPRDSAVFPLKTNNHNSNKQYSQSLTKEGRRVWKDRPQKKNRPGVIISAFVASTMMVNGKINTRPRRAFGKRPPTPRKTNRGGLPAIWRQVEKTTTLGNKQQVTNHHHYPENQKENQAGHSPWDARWRVGQFCGVYTAVKLELCRGVDGTWRKFTATCAFYAPRRRTNAPETALLSHSHAPPTHRPSPSAPSLASAGPAVISGQQQQQKPTHM